MKDCVVCNHSLQEMSCLHGIVLCFQHREYNGSIADLLHAFRECITPPVLEIA